MDATAGGGFIGAAANACFAGGGEAILVVDVAVIDEGVTDDAPGAILVGGGGLKDAAMAGAGLVGVGLGACFAVGESFD